MIFVILPLTGILLLSWLVTRKSFFGKVLLGIWSLIIFTLVVGSILRPLNEKIVLEKSDYYGHYIIDRSYFPGTQADWQYNTYRFEITEQDSIFFYVTDGQEIQRTYHGTVSTGIPNNHTSERLVVQMKQPSHHVLATNPTTYRDIWDFYLVFESPKFHNMYFTKGNWTPIDE